MNPLEDLPALWRESEDEVCFIPRSSRDPLTLIDLNSVHDACSIRE